MSADEALSGTTMLTLPLEEGTPDRATNCHPNEFARLSVRSRNSLMRAGIKTVWSLMATSPDEIFAIRNVGPKSLSEILDLRESLRSAGSWSDSQHEPANSGPLAMVESAEASRFIDAERVRACLERLREELSAGLLHPDLPLFEIEGNAYTVRGLLRIEPEALLARCDVDSVQRLDSFVRALDTETVDDEIRFALAGLSPRERLVLVRRHGIPQASTLVELGRELGVTSERVRQIQVQARRKIARRLDFYPLPRTRSAILWVAALGQRQSLGAAEENLAERGVLTSHGAFLDMVALWRSTVVMTPFPDALLVSLREGLTPAQLEMRSAVLALAEQLIRSCGAAPVALLRQAEAARDVVAILAHDGYEEAAPGWYMRSLPSRCVPEHVARKLLAVTDRVSVHVFRLALARNSRRPKFPTPPEHVLAAVACRIPFVRLEGPDLVRTAALDPEVELSRPEVVLWRCVKEHGAVVTRSELSQAIESAGFSNATLVSQLSFSPIIRRVGPSLYSLASGSVSPADVAGAMARARSAAE